MDIFVKVLKVLKAHWFFFAFAAILLAIAGA